MVARQSYFVYPYAKHVFVGARPGYELNWVHDRFYAVLCNETMDPSPSLRSLSDVPLPAILCSPVELTGNRIFLDRATSSSPTFLDVRSGSNIRYLLIFHGSEDPSTSELVTLTGLTPGLSEGKPFTVRICLTL